MKKILCSLGLVLSSSLMANFVPPPCGVALQGELLYWCPLVDVDAVARITPATNALEAERVYNNFDFHPALRVGALYSFNECNLIEARFTYFNGGHRKTIAGDPFITNTNSFIVTGELPSDVHLKYYGADLILQNIECSGPTIDVSFFEGLHYASINFHSHSSISGVSPFGDVPASDNIVQKSWFWGVGPEVGARTNYVLPCFCNRSIAFVGDVRGALLVGEQKMRNTSSGLFDVNSFFRKHFTQDKWLVTPFFDCKLGFDWNCQFSCFATHAEIGYEYVWYRSAAFTSGDTGSEPLSNDVGFHGPYAALGVSF